MTLKSQPASFHVYGVTLRLYAAVGFGYEIALDDE